ncbi:hypothetical protein D8674_011766 [Pyrus ussuriensis x Pyrus communis]|uniref:Uncharacterized protein n=1 Tax=Pyrus ussuriensis x Pyrus communis TaxID=2448454 RepID=A0A5N5FZN5_9ROSA|nr:hypothetical protein D8674_011766 [Pyrus ussuriensis x Pyrus communis]
MDHDCVAGSCNFPSFFDGTNYVTWNLIDMDYLIFEWKAHLRTVDGESMVNAKKFQDLNEIKLGKLVGKLVGNKTCVLKLENMELIKKLNEAVYKIDYLTLDAEKFNEVPCVRSPYDANNALVFVDSGSCLKSINSQVMEESLFVTLMMFGTLIVDVAWPTLLEKGAVKIPKLPQLENVCYVAGLKTNLLSISQLCDDVADAIRFSKRRCKIIEKDKKNMLVVPIASTFLESSVIPTFLTTRAVKFYKVVIARAIVPERQVVWDDLPIEDAIIANDLIDHYKLHKWLKSSIRMFPPNFQILEVKCLEPFNASNIHSFDLITYHYDIHVYHRQAYLDSSVALVKNQVSKSRLKPLYRPWAYFLRRNVVGSSNKGNRTLEATRVLYAMMSFSNMPFGFPNFSFNHCVGVPFHPDDVCPRSTKELDKGLLNLSNVMSTISHGDLHLSSPPNASQERNIAYLESELYSL